MRISRDAVSQGLSPWLLIAAAILLLTVIFIALRRRGKRAGHQVSNTL